jgi:hypothetical protein
MICRKEQQRTQSPEGIRSPLPNLLTTVPPGLVSFDTRKTGWVTHEVHRVFVPLASSKEPD